MINTMFPKLSGACRLPFLALIVASLAVLPGCDLAKNHLKPDRGINLEKQDYRDAMASRLPEVEDSEGGGADASSIPMLQSYIAQSTQAMKAMPLVSISVNQSVSLRDILFELARQADYDLELDPSIRGSIIFTARDRPFDQVIERISNIAGLRYSFNNEVLRVEVDSLYNKTYKIDYLNFVRTNSSGVNNNIAVVSGEGADTGSSFSSKSEGESDFWGELDTALAQIIGGEIAKILSGIDGSLKTQFDPRITATERSPDVQAVAPVSEDGNITVQPPEAVLNVEALPVDGGSGASSGGSSRPNLSLNRLKPQPSFSINKQAGLVNVFAPERTHKEVTEYFRLLRRSTTAQVLIEAKILEVTLSDEYKTGIDWQQVGFLSPELVGGFFNNGSLVGAVSNTSFPVPTAGTNITGSRNFVMGYNGNDVQALVDAISGYGTVRALASPRMTVLNNQSAVINVATNRVFFEIDIDITQDGGGGVQTEIDSDIRNVPEGVLMNVLPSINLDERTISLALRPTITNIVQSISDPAIQFVTAAADPPIEGVESLIPELNVQEIDTVIKVDSGQTVVMGGLLQDKTTVTEEGVPVLSEIPMFGALFRDHADVITKTELVIFIKATILNSPGDSIHDTDRDLYRKFSDDRRPFKL